MRRQSVTKSWVSLGRFFSRAVGPRPLTGEHYLLWLMRRGLAPSCRSLEIIHWTQWPLKKKKKKINSKVWVLNLQSWRVRCFHQSRRFFQRRSGVGGGLCTDQREACSADQCFQSNSIIHKCWEASPNQRLHGAQWPCDWWPFQPEGICGAGLS